MKKTYIIPNVGITLMETQKMFCQSPDGLKGASSRFGNATGNYGNPDWVNEGHTSSTSQDGVEAIEIGENEGTVDSRSKGMIWDEW